MLRLVLALLANLFILPFWPFLWWRRRTTPRGAFVELEIDGSLGELTRKQPFWMRQKPSESLYALERAIDLMAADARVAGFLLIIKNLRAGSATATSLRNLLLRARAAGKRVVVYLPSGAGTRDSYVASAADAIWVGPETFIAPLGFALETPYLRRVLDRAGIEPEVFAKGRYKSAGESLVRDSMSEAQREQLEALLDVAWDVLLEALSSGRRVTREQARHFIENGPWSANHALEQGFIDGIAYADELDKKLAPSADEEPTRVSVKRYLRRKRAGFVPFRRRPAIAVVEIKGAIVSQHVGVAPAAAEDEVCAALDRARETARYRAAVLCIDSPGGSALASDRMLHAIRRLAEKKPVIASMGDAAASGGYMVSAGAHAIFAQPTTITGSIGVVSARVLLEPLLDRLGIGVEVVKRGARADMMSARKRLAPEERAAVEGQLEHIYRSFLQAVATGRSRSVAEIEPLAGGRVWSGRDAEARGLVDHLGGFAEALAEARRRLPSALARAEPELVSPPHLRPPRGLIPRLIGTAALVADAIDPSLLPLAMRTGRREVGYLWCAYRETDLGAA